MDKETIRSSPSAKSDESDELRAIIYGTPGSGKTTFAATANKDKRTSPCLMLDLEGGTKSIRSQRRFVEISELGSPQPGLIDILRIRDFDDLRRAYDFLFDRKFKDPRSSYNSLIGDSLTEINYLSLKFMMNKTPPGVARLEADVPEQRDYLKTNSAMKDMLRAFRDIEGLHVIWTALPQERTEGEGSKLIQVKPSLIGKLADESMAIVDVVGFMQFDRLAKQYELVLRPEGRFVAKVRTEVSDNPLTKIVDPTVGKLLDALGVK